MSVRGWLGTGLTLVLVVAHAATLSAQPQDLCSDPADAAFRSCLKELASYGSWMIVPARQASPGDLQQAIDEVYKGVQEEWTGPVRLRVHVRSLYVYLPLLVALYAGAVFAVSRIVRPRLPSGGPPIWRIEKITLALGLVLTLGAMLLERSLSYQRMMDTYSLVQGTVQRFVHLRSPQLLANATTKPCETYFSDSDALVAMCHQDWAAQARSKLGRIVGTRLTAPALLQHTIRIGEACKNVGTPPPWWTNVGDPGERMMKLPCEVHRSGESSVRFEELAGLGDLPRWLLPGSSTPLRLEDIFNVQTAGGDGAVYRQKVASLVGSESFADYRQRFLATSWQLCGSAAILLLGTAFLLYYARRAELDAGSKTWATIRSRVAPAIVALGLVVCLAGLTGIMFS